MVFLALKLKTHLTLDAPTLANPNILVLTDRIDLDDQISRTFVACGLPNPTQCGSVAALREAVKRGGNGQILLSTIFKFAGSKEPIPNSANWIVLVDECHRTQEKDLGAYLQATLPDAHFYGFTGTPIKSTDKDTYARFSVAGEGYLDKYGIDDAVRDGATVPILYEGRKTDWAINEAEIDILFDRWFVDLPDDKREELKRKGLTLATIAKHPERLRLIALDIWEHFKAVCQPDGFKAQVVVVDREAVRDMLEQHVHATGLSTTIRLRSITDPEFADDFATEGKGEPELKEAFVRKSAELRRVTRELVDKNPAQYGRFSERVMEIIRRFEEGQLAAADGLRDFEGLTGDIQAEQGAHTELGMDENAFSILRIMETIVPAAEHAVLQDAAIAIGAVYTDAAATQPSFAHMEAYLRSLRQQVRRILTEQGIGETKTIREKVEEFAIHAYGNGY